MSPRTSGTLTEIIRSVYQSVQIYFERILDYTKLSPLKSFLIHDSLIIILSTLNDTDQVVKQFYEIKFSTTWFISALIIASWYTPHTRCRIVLRPYSPSCLKEVTFYSINDSIRTAHVTVSDNISVQCACKCENVSKY
jgi:hypothetical protein